MKIKTILESMVKLPSILFFLNDQNLNLDHAGGRQLSDYSEFGISPLNKKNYELYLDGSKLVIFSGNTFMKTLN